MVGEQINDLLSAFLKAGMDLGDFRSDLEVLPTIFSFWGMLAGLIRLAENKETYISHSMKKSKMEFLMYGFELLYRSIAA